MYKKTIDVDQGDQEKACGGDILDSGGLGPCIAIAVYNPKTKCGIMMHESNFAYDNNLHERLKEIVEELGNPQNLKVFATGNSVFSNDSLEMKKSTHESRYYVDAALPLFFKKENIRTEWIQDDYQTKLILDTETGKCFFEPSKAPTRLNMYEDDDYEEDWSDDEE